MSRFYNTLFSIWKIFSKYLSNLKVVKLCVMFSAMPKLTFSCPKRLPRFPVATRKLHGPKPVPASHFACRANCKILLVTFKIHRHDSFKLISPPSTKLFCCNMSIYCNIRASSSGLGYILIYVGQSYSSVGHKYTRVRQTINLSFT
jgi:hypothetical protein